MRDYYYNTADVVWSTWSESDIRKWLVDYGVVKSNALIKREKLQKLMECA